MLQNAILCMSYYHVVLATPCYTVSFYGMFNSYLSVQMCKILTHVNFQVQQWTAIHVIL